MSECRFLVLVIGTPVDEHLNPELHRHRTARSRPCAAHLRDGQILILRSTVFPGISEHIQKDLAGPGPGHRRRVLPGARGPGPQPARDPRSCRRSSSAFDADDARGGARAVRPVRPRVHRDDADGGRALQADDQRLALHPVRHRQPVLHDRDRARPRLRPHPARLPPQLSADGGHARARASPRGRAWSRTRCSSPPSATTSSSLGPRGHAGQRGPAGPPGRAGAPRAADLSRAQASASSAWRSRPRATTRAIRCATSCASCSSSRRASVLCTDPYVPDPDARAARATCSPRPTCSSSRTPHSAYRELRIPDGQDPSSTSGTASPEQRRRAREDPRHRLGRLHRRLSRPGAARRRGTRSSASTTTPSTAAVEKSYQQPPGYTLRRGRREGRRAADELAARLRSLRRRRRADRRHLATSTSTPTTCWPRTSGSSPPASTPRIAAPHEQARSKKITVLSSSMVYENATVFPTPGGRTLAQCPPPTSTYGFQKLACEYFAEGAWEQYSCRTRSAGPSTASASARAGRSATRRSRAATSSWR